MPGKIHKNISFFIVISIIVLLLGVFLWNSRQTSIPSGTPAVQQTGDIVSGKFDETKFKSDAEWKKLLTPEQYHILREAGTEIPFTGELNHEKRKGTYYSVGCDKPLFRSEQKFDSGTGWPSFWAPVDDNAVVLRREKAPDDRIEVLDTCGNHLGHVFDDGPQPTGKRYCMNSLALRFVPDEENN